MVLLLLQLVPLGFVEIDEVVQKVQVIPRGDIVEILCLFHEFEVDILNRLVDGHNILNDDLISQLIGVLLGDIREGIHRRVYDNRELFCHLD